MKTWIPLVARLLVTVIFVPAALSKLTGWDGNASYMASRGIPLVPVALALALVIESVGSVCLVLGWRAREAAAVMAVYLVPVTLYCHELFGTQFNKNLGIIGGLLMIVAYGPGRLALDRRARILAVGLVAMAIGCGAAAPARDSFVGDWKLNPARSSATDLMKVQRVTGTTYAFDFGGGAETIAADGTDQPGNSGTTLAVTIDGPDAWTIVRKQAGRMMITAHWKLSQDGNTLRDDYLQLAPDGQVDSHATYLYHRTEPGPGFAGAWEGQITLAKSLSSTLLIRPYDAAGLSFIYPTAQLTRNLELDGKDYPVVGHGAVEGATSSARWVDPHTLAFVDKTHGKVTRNHQIELSLDHKTVTQTAHPVGQHGPTIFVFERQ